MKNKRAFTLLELLIVLLLLGLVLAIIFRLMTSAFSGATKGYANLSILQEKSSFIAALKQDMRTIIIGGVDNIPAPVLVNSSSDQTGRTSNIEFRKVYGIDNFGRPLIEKITYRLSPETPLPDKSYGITRNCEFSQPRKKTFLTSMLTHLRIDLLDPLGAPIIDAGKYKNMKKVRLVMTSEGSELLATTLSVYSPYIPATSTASLGDLWCPNYMFAEYPPGAPIKLFQNGTIMIVGDTALGNPLSLAGATTLSAP